MAAEYAHNPDLPSQQSHWHVRDVVPGFTPLSAAYLSHIHPQEEWYREPAVYYGHHGEFHIPRLILGIHLVSRLLRLSEGETEELIATAFIHDSQRTNEGRNRHHGTAAAIWWEENLDLLPNAQAINIEQRQHVLHLARYHETHEEEIPNGELTERELYLLEVFKLCDALDRYRDQDPERHINFERYGKQEERREIREVGEQIAPLMKQFIENTEWLRRLTDWTAEDILYVAATEYGFVRR